MPNQDLEQRLTKLEELFASHQHLGNDGSSIFYNNTQFNGASSFLNPKNIFGAQTAFYPLVITDGLNDNTVPRIAGVATATTNKNKSTEEVLGAFGSGLALPSNYIPKRLNQVDWTQFSTTTMYLTHSPNSVPFNSGPSFLAGLSGLRAAATPQPRGTGTIVAGTSVLVDSEADFVADSLIGCVLAVNRKTYKIISNTTNTITIGYKTPVETVAKTFADTGTYTYAVIKPILLGDNQYVYSRLYIGEDIKLGYGATTSTEVCFIKWGYGSPEGKVSANTGSIYLNIQGGTNTTLYVKESGANGATGWVAK